MAELATIARPYAQALFEVAEGGGAQQTAAQLDALAALAADDRLRQFASNPKVADAQVFDLMTAVAGTPLSDSVRNLLRTVLDNGRLAALPEIAAQFRALVNAHSGMSDAIVYSAYPIDNAQLGDVVATLEKRFGRKLHATVQLAPELIGGIRVVVGDEVLDTSVAARLQQMKMALAA
ncbi:MAG TPA: F0F1 ATP synthase subunit delta [Ideonella sp.]|jgi:F-type H+-transporting ATPase subunit delta|nr:F0F1 ATP synthase subunit delta [Ideonella sp.]